MGFTSRNFWPTVAGGMSRPAPDPKPAAGLPQAIVESCWEIKPGLDRLELGLTPEWIEGPVHPERQQVEIVEALSPGQPLQSGHVVSPLSPHWA
jgi:hypothetical protein